MTIYSALRDRALDQVGCTGQTEAQTIAQAALEEAMKFVNFHVRIPSLTAEASATAGASPELESNAIAIETTGFSITAGVFQCTDRLYVKTNSTITEKGTPYEYREYLHFLDLKNIAAGSRTGIMSPGVLDERPQYCYTITPSNKIWATPLTQNNVLTLMYRKAPAAYSGAVAPEILPLFDYILVNGAVIALKEWLREPESITTWWSLFENGLKADIERYDSFLNSGRKRTGLKLHRAYRIR